MQLLHDNKTIAMAMKDISNSANSHIKDTSSSTFDVKEKKSSNASLMMNPVASGDNVTTGMNSAHKLKEELPPLVPCCEGRELEINEDVVRTGLSAISVRHDNVVQCLSLSRACDRLQNPFGLVKHRNSFRCLHRPDLKRVPYLRRMTPNELETLFRGYSELPTKGHAKPETHEEATKQPIPPDEKGRNVQETHLKKQPEIVDSNALHPIPEFRRGSEDLPAGMRLHGTRARLYTSVLAGAKAGDQLDGNPTNEEYDTQIPDDILPDDEEQLHEELQIILPPKCDDMTAAESSMATSSDTLS